MTKDGMKDKISMALKDPSLEGNHSSRIRD